MQFIKVKLNHIALELDSEMVIFFKPLFDLEHFKETSWHNTEIVWLTSNSISFTWSCLTISEDTNIKPINCALNQHFCVLKNFFLIGFGSKACIEHIFFFNILTLLCLWALALSVKLLIFLDPYFERELIYNWYGVNTTHSYFVLVHGSYSAVYSDLTLHVFYDVMKSFSLDSFCLIFKPKSLILFSHIFNLILIQNYFMARILPQFFHLSLNLFISLINRFNLTLVPGLLLPILSDDFLELPYLLLLLLKLTFSMLVNLLQFTLLMLMLLFDLVNLL